MGSFLAPEGVLVFAPTLDPKVVEGYIEHVEAIAVFEAPCLANVWKDHPYYKAVQSILTQAVLRWARAGDGDVTTEQRTADVFSHSVTIDTRSRGVARLTDGEIRKLREICRRMSGGGGRRKAFTVMPR